MTGAGNIMLPISGNGQLNQHLRFGNIAYIIDKMTAVICRSGHVLEFRAKFSFTTVSDIKLIYLSTAEYTKNQPSQNFENANPRSLLNTDAEVSNLSKSQN